jgi:hypothetical protein
MAASSGSSLPICLIPGFAQRQRHVGNEDPGKHRQSS